MGIGLALAPLVFAVGMVPVNALPPTDGASSQQAVGSATFELAPKPLPDIPTMMHDVETHQRLAEKVQKDYIYHSVETTQELDGQGKTKKTKTREFDDFWVSGVPVRQLVEKDGRALTPDEEKKESERIDKEAAKARERRDNGDASGRETDPRGNDEITVSRFLELGRFENARRVQLNGRDTIAVDYEGDPKAKTRNRSEEVIRDLVGTVWVDEQDRMISRIEGHFLNAFKVAGGLLINIRRGTSFALELKKVNDEVWLPARVNGRGAARVLLVFNFDGTEEVVYSDYRKFKATSTILPGLSTVERNEPLSPPIRNEGDVEVP
jgi:hypothetical protein